MTIIQLLEKTLERLDTLADPSKEAAHEAVLVELLLSRERMRETLLRTIELRNILEGSPNPESR